MKDSNISKPASSKTFFENMQDYRPSKGAEKK